MLKWAETCTFILLVSSAGKSGRYLGDVSFYSFLIGVFIHHIMQLCSCVPIGARKLIKTAGLWFLLAVAEYILFCNIWHLRAACLQGAWAAGLGSWSVRLLKHVFVLTSKLTGCETLV